MKPALIWTWLVASGIAVVAGAWFVAEDALVVVIAAIVWVLASGWIVSRLTTP